jgi:hypothetical protein
LKNASWNNQIKEFTGTKGDRVENRIIETGYESQSRESQSNTSRLFSIDNPVNKNEESKPDCYGGAGW